MYDQEQRMVELETLLRREIDSGNRRRRRRLSIGLGLVASVALWSYAHAQSLRSEMISYQGTLEENGVPVDSTRTLDFELFDSLTSMSPMWSETQTVDVSSGRFAVSLGAVTPIPPAVFDTPALFLEVRVEGTVLNGRQRIMGTPYAHNGVPAGTVVAWYGDPGMSPVPEGWAVCDGTNGTPDLRDRFIAGAGTAYALGATGGTPTGDHDHTSTSVGNHSHITPIWNNGAGVLHAASTDFPVATNYRPGNPWSYAQISGGSTSTSTRQDFLHTKGNGGHSHTVGTTVLDNRPPYFALTYIIKL